MRAQRLGYSQGRRPDRVTAFFLFKVHTIMTTLASQPPPPKAEQPTRTLSVLVENRFGVLSRIAGLISARGYNIESLTVAGSSDAALSRITMVVRCESELAQQMLKQMNKLVDVVTAVDLSDANCVERELVLVRVRAPQEKRATLLTEAEIFRARDVTATRDNYGVEVTGETGTVEALVDVGRTY